MGQLLSRLDVNTEIENMKAMVIKACLHVISTHLNHKSLQMIKAGLPVFFGCDVGKFSDRTSGIMDPDLFAYENAFDIKLGMTKAGGRRNRGRELGLYIWRESARRGGRKAGGTRRKQKRSKNGVKTVEIRP